MAFTESQKAQVRLALGYPFVYQDRNSRLESAFDLLGADASVSAIVVAILAQLTAVGTALESSLSSAGLKRAEDIEWYNNGAGGSAVIDQKRAEGRRYCGQLSILFGVPIMADMFGEGGYEGDRWMGSNYQYGVNAIKLG